jgi:hypothetical protein
MIGPRSPKDVLGGVRPVSTATEALRLLARSERVNNDTLWYTTNSAMFVVML